MVRETRYLLVGNLPENVTKKEISEYFERYSKIQEVKIHDKKDNEDTVCATVAFADITSASKAYSAENSIRGKILSTTYSQKSSATGSVVSRTLDEPRPSYSANRPSSYGRKGPEDGEVYEGRDYYSSQSGQYSNYTEEFQRGRPRDRYAGRGGFKQFDARGGHHQWTAGQRRFPEGHRSNSSSDRDAFEKPRAPISPARSASQTSRKSMKIKRIQSNSTSRSRSGSSDSSSSSSYSDSSSDSSRSRSRSGSRSSNRASRLKLPSTVKSGRSRSQDSNASENTETTEGGNRPHGIKITNLPGRSSDTSLRDGLFHEYKKYGKVNAVQVSGNADGRFAIVSFKKSEDARKALDASQDKRFFGTNIRVCEHEGIDVDDAEFRPPEAELDEHHPKATRTLFVGNLEKEITMEELKIMFSKFGEILDIDVKRQGAISAYSFIQFTDIKSVVKALRALDGETMGGMKLKLGFGKSMPTNCVWVDNVADSVQENFLCRQFARYGPLANMVIDREHGKALIFYSSLENAQFALGEMRNRILNGQKIQIDFASKDCQRDFYDKMEKTGQLKPGQRYQRQSSDGQRGSDRGRGKFNMFRGTGRGFVRGSHPRWMPGRGYSKEHAGEEYRRQRSYDEYSEGDFESDLVAYRTQRERQRSCSPDQYSDEMYRESYREFKAARYAEYAPGSPGSDVDGMYEYKPREEMYYKERYMAGSREASPEENFQVRRSWSRSPSHSRVKDPEHDTPPTPLGGDDTQDFSSQEQSPTEMDESYNDYKRSGKNDFDITEDDIQELRTSKYSAHRKEHLTRSGEKSSRKRSYEDTFRDSISKEELSARKLDKQISHGNISEAKRDLFNKVKKHHESGVKSEGQYSSNSSDSGSLTGGDLSKLKHERQMLLEKIKLCEDPSELDITDLSSKKIKRTKLEQWKGSPRLQSELGSVIHGSKKDKSYDVSLSYRKQMEAMRKTEEKPVKDDSKSKKNDIYSYEEEKDENLVPQGLLLSPKDVPSGFVKKRRKTDFSEDVKTRTYRHKRENEEDRMSSDNDESAKLVLRTDSIGSLGSNRRLSSGHSSPRTPITGHLSLENLEHKLSESEQSNPESQPGSLTFKKLDSAKRRSKEEHSSPVLIPLGDDNLVTEIPDPRVPKDKQDEVILQLPKFAEYTPPLKLNSPGSDNSIGVKEDSPCFSPPSSGSKNESPHSSPIDTNSEGSQTNSNPEPAYIPPEDNSNNSNEPTLENPVNEEMEVEKPPMEGEVDDGLSDSSDHNEDFSLNERIRQLDEKLKQLPTTQPSKLSTDNLSSPSTLGINITSSIPQLSNDYKSKYKIKKRQDSVGITPDESDKGEKQSSEIVKTMLNRSSIFDLDSKRLKQNNEKYSPSVNSVVSSTEESSKNVTLRTKAEAKEMPLSTLPGSLAGRLGNGTSSFPTLSSNTQPLSVKVDEKPFSSSPPLSQENKTADVCTFNSDSRSYDRMDLSSYSQRNNSIDNGLNRTSLNTSTRTMADSVIESAEKSDSVTPCDSNVRSDPRLNSKSMIYKTDKTAEPNMDINNKKLDNCVDVKVRNSPPKSLETIGIKSEPQIENDTIGIKVTKSDIVNEDTSMDISTSNIALGKRKCDITKKDKVNSPSDTEKDVSKVNANVKSGSESPDSKRVKLSTPEKDKSDKSEAESSPNHSDSAKTDKLKKDNSKKNKDSKKKEKSECESPSKDKGFNDKKDKDHDGDKTKGLPKSDNAEGKPSPDLTKKDPSVSKTEGEKQDKVPQVKKETEKKSEPTVKKEKKSESSKKSGDGKSSDKKDGKPTDPKTKDKPKSSHKPKDSSSKNKDDKSTNKDGKSHSSSKVAKSSSSAKAETPKDSKTNEAKDNASNESTEKKDSDKKPEGTKDQGNETKDKDKSSEAKKNMSEKPKSSGEGKHKTKPESSKPKSSDSKHKSKTEGSDQHKSKTNQDGAAKKDGKDKSSLKAKHKDSKSKEKSSSSGESAKSKEKLAETKQSSTEKMETDEKASDAKTTESEPAKNVEKTKSTDEVKVKSENIKSKESSQKPKSETDKTKSDGSVKKEKTKHSDSTHGKNKVKTSSTHTEKSKDKSHKDSSKKDDDHSKADTKKEGNGESKTSSSSNADNKTSSSSSSKPSSESTSEKTETSSNGSESKSDKSENKSESKTEKQDSSKSENSSGNTDSLSKSSGKSDSKKDKKSDSKSSSKKKSSSDKKSDSKSSEKKSSKKESKKEDKVSPKEEKSKKSSQSSTPKKQEVEFDWSAWMEEPYTSMYDRVKRKSSEKIDKEREIKEKQKKFSYLQKSRNNKKHSKFSDSDESEFMNDSDEETDAFEEEKVAKPSKEVHSSHDSTTKRKRCVIDTSTSSDDDDSQLYKSFQKNTFTNKEKDKSTVKVNKHNVNDIYSSDSSETDIDFPPISPAKKKTRKTKKTKKMPVHHDTDSDYDHPKDKSKKKIVTPKPKTKSVPKKKPETKPAPPSTQTDTHESDLYDIDSDNLDRFERIKLKNQKKLLASQNPKHGKMETTTDDSDAAMFLPSRKSNKKEIKPIKKSILDDSLFDTDSDSSFPDLTPMKNHVKKNHVADQKKPTLTVGSGVIAQTIRNEDIGGSIKKEKVKKKTKKSENDKKTESSKAVLDNFVNEVKDKSSKHNKKEGKSPRGLDYLDEEEISQAEKLVNNMSKLEKPMKHDNKSTKVSKSDHKGKSPRMDYAFSSDRETDTEKVTKSLFNDHVTKPVKESHKDGEKKTKSSKPKKKVENGLIEKSSPESGPKKETSEKSKKNNKGENGDSHQKKKTPKAESEEVINKKPTSKLDMDADGPLRKHSNKSEKEEGYKLGFGFFVDFPILEDSKLDEINKKKDKKKEEEAKSGKKETPPTKTEAKTPKKKEKKKKDAGFELGIKENGPKLDDLVGKWAGVTHNSDVFDFQDEEDNNKPLFADFFKMKEEMTKKANGKKGSDDGKKSEKRLSSEEKSDETGSESHDEKAEDKKKKQEIEDDKKTEVEREEEAAVKSLFGSDDKLDDSTISGMSMFSPKHVKEACNDETKNIMAFASPKGIDLIKSDDEGSKSGLLSPTKSDLLCPKDRYRRDMMVGHVEMENRGIDLKSKDTAEAKWEMMKQTGENSKKTDIFGDLSLKAKKDVKEISPSKKEVAESKKEEKSEVPEKSREEILEDAVLSLQKISETPSIITPEPETFTEGELVIDETTAAVETISEAPVVEEQVQNETDLAILSIMPMDDKAPYTEPVTEPPVQEQPENVLIETEQVTLDTNPLDSSLGEDELVIDTSVLSDTEPAKEEQQVVVPEVTPVPEKSPEKKTRQTKSKRNQKNKAQTELQKDLLNQEVNKNLQEIKDKVAMAMPQEHPVPVQAAVHPTQQPPFMFNQIMDSKHGKAILDSSVPNKKTRKQRANSKTNHQVEVPGTFYPPVYNSADQGLGLVNHLAPGDASEKENEEKLSQSFNSDAEKSEDLDHRVSGDEGNNNADKRSRRGRKQQNYKELNSGVHGRTASPRSRTSPRSPRTGMSPRQALSPLSSPKSELSTTGPFVKIERLPLSTNKNIRNEGELSNDAFSDAKQQLFDSLENHQPDHQNIVNTKKLVEDLIKPPTKEGTSVFDFDDTEPELKIETKPSRQKKGRRNTLEANLNAKTNIPEVKTTIGAPNHLTSPMESRWQCKKDESEKTGNPPLKLTIALAHSTDATSHTNTVINSATIIDSTIPSIKGKKEVESVMSKVSTTPTPTSLIESIVSIAMSKNTTPSTAVTAPTAATKTAVMSNVDKIIDDVAKGIFNFVKGSDQQPENKEGMALHDQSGPTMRGLLLQKATEESAMAGQTQMQPTKKRPSQGRNQEDGIMPPPMMSPPGHEFMPPKSSPNTIPPPVSSPFGSVVMSLPQAQPLHNVTVTTCVGAPSPVATSSPNVSLPGQIGEPQLLSPGSNRSTPQMGPNKQKLFDMALNMTSKAEVTMAAHCLSTAAVVTQTTTTTIAQQSPGTSVVMSTQKPMVTSSGPGGNTTVLAGRTVTVKPPNTEAYLHQMGISPSAIPSQAHQPIVRGPDSKQGFPPGFIPNPAFSRPDMHQQEHGRPPTQAGPPEKQQMQATSTAAPTCVVHPITSAKGAVDPKLLHQQMLQAVSGRPSTITTSSGHVIPPAHMQPTQAQMMEKEQQMRNIAAMHGQPMMHLMGQPPHVMPNHIQHKEKPSKGRQSQKADMQQPNDMHQRPPSAHNHKPSVSEPQRPLSAHNNIDSQLREMLAINQAKGMMPQDMLTKGLNFQDMLAKGLISQELLAKGMIPPGVMSPAFMQMFHHQQQLAKMEEKKGHKMHQPKEMISPGIAHQPSSMMATSIASQSSNPQIKSPALAQTAPSPHPMFSQPSTSQARANSPGHKKMSEKILQNHWSNENLNDGRNESQKSRPTSVEPSPSPKHLGFNGSQKPQPAHMSNSMDFGSKTHQDAIRLIEHHKQKEMLQMQEREREREKIQEMQRQEMQRREEIFRQQNMKSRDNVPSTSANSLQQSERDRQTASVPGKPRSGHMPSHSESGPSGIDPRALQLQELQRRGQSAFATPGGEVLQGLPAHIYREQELQQRLQAAAALGMPGVPPHLLDQHMFPPGYPLGMAHPYLRGLPLDHPHMADGRPPSRSSQPGMRSPPPRQAHQNVPKSPAVPGQNRQMQDPPPGEGSLLSLLQRYPVMWQGTLALKNDSCAVQMHVISGFKSLVQTALPQQIIEGTCQPLRIAQRMRLETAQLEGVIKRMQYDKDYCMLLALPCGSDHDDIIFQTRQMSTGFIQYLQQKQAAGIVNVADPRSQQPAYVVHIFPPCEFSHDTLGRLGFELLHQVRNLSHLLVIITTVA